MADTVDVSTEFILYRQIMAGSFNFDELVLSSLKPRSHHGMELSQTIPGLLLIRNKYLIIPELGFLLPSGGLVFLPTKGILLNPSKAVLTLQWRSRIRQISAAQ